MEQNRKAGQNPPRVVAPTEEQQQHSLYFPTFPCLLKKEMPMDSTITGHGRSVMPNEQVGLLNPCPFETHKLIQNTRCDLLMRNGK